MGGETVERGQKVEGAPENGWSARSRVTREKLIATASKLMVQKGIKSVSVAAVAREAGITRPGAYYHFKSRQDLLDAVGEATDLQLIRSVAGSSSDDHIFSQAAELAAEDEVAIHLRIQKMLELGPKDIIISSRQRSFEQLKREGSLQAGVDTHIGAIISGASIVAAFLAVSQAKTKKRRHQLAKVFGNTNYQYLFHGVLKAESLDLWPELPKYSGSVIAGKQSGEEDSAHSSDARRQKSKQTRELLMNATMRMMADDGEEAVSVAEVARRAGVTRPGAYYHFKKKQDLIAAVEKKLDQELLFTLDRSFALREAFRDATDLSTENLSLLKIRVHQMLRDGVSNDPLIAHYKQIFKFHKKHEHLKPDVDPNMAAIMAATISLVGVYMVVSESDTVEGRRRLANRFRKTYRKFVFDGILNIDSDNDWPSPPDTKT